MANFEYPTNYTVGNETQAVEGIGSLFTYTNYALNSWFGGGILLIIFMLVFGAGSLIGIGSSFAAASFVTFIFSVYFARLGLVSTTLPLVLAVFTIIGFFWAKTEKPNY